MNKSQKLWLWVSLTMFIIPEVFFSAIPSFFASLYGVIDFPFLYKLFINPQFFIDNPIYLFIVLGVECFGVFGLLIWNVKFNDNKYKIVLTIVTSLVLVFLAFLFFVGYSVTNMSFP